MLACQMPKPIKREAIRKLADGRELCITAAGWEQRRKEVFKREKGLCEKCKNHAPLHKTEQSFAGHAHHVNGRKRNDDRAEVLEWLCAECHRKSHIPDKVLPPKHYTEVTRQLQETA